MDADDCQLHVIFVIAIARSRQDPSPMTFQQGEVPEVTVEVVRWEQSSRCWTRRANWPAGLRLCHVAAAPCPAEVLQQEIILYRPCYLRWPSMQMLSSNRCCHVCHVLPAGQPQACALAATVLVHAVSRQRSSRQWRWKAAASLCQARRLSAARSRSRTLPAASAASTWRCTASSQCCLHTWTAQSHRCSTLTAVCTIDHKGCALL